MVNCPSPAVLVIDLRSVFGRDRHRRSPNSAGIPCVSRSPVDIPIGSRRVQKDLDIQEYTDPEHNPMIPHTLVLKPGLLIYSIYNGYWFWGRPSVIDLWHDLRSVTSEIRRRLGPEHPRTPRGVECWRLVALPRLE